MALSKGRLTGGGCPHEKSTEYTDGRTGQDSLLTDYDDGLLVF